MEYGILGPLTVSRGGRELRLGGARQRSLLAVLLLRANEPVPTARIVDELWGERPPATAVKAVQVQVSQLRKLLDEGALQTRPTGYLLRVEPGALDLERFERLLEQGRERLAQGDASEAGELLREALGLWRGSPLAEFEYEAFARNEIGRLEELRLAALELRLEADLALGRHTEVVGELEGLVRDHPQRESFTRQLILALYRAGRQADALAAYQQTRTRLRDELGLDPSEALQQLEKQILRHDPTLELPSAAARSGLPLGTVTFVFTDVEGSTRLLHELGADAYAAVLGEHRRVVRETCASFGGAEVDTQGDAFFLAFARAPDAVEAAGVITERLRGGPVRVRMGVHTGSPLATDEGYVGADVHRAARIAAAGHGGQVLVSSSTAALVGVPLRDLGEHRFKDLRAPERVFQLGLEEFPPLRSLYRTNLPVPATAFLGRERELDEVVGLLCREDVHLVTLTGPGGTGKTRLALQAAAEVAERFPDGLWWVALSPLRDPELVLPAVAQALEVDEKPGAGLLDGARERFGDKRLLILLDNAEHLLPGVASELNKLRSAAPSLSLLVTSRERLQVSGEAVWPVPALAGEEGVELFLARSRSLGADPADGSAVRHLCSRLDNLPLALELAAARTTVFSPEELLERVGQRLDLFRGGRDADPRQQTLRATIDWSHQLLDDREQRVFRALSIFAGGCTFEAAEYVAGADPDTLQSLLDKSLLRRRDTTIGARYWMLETIREYAAERLHEADVSVVNRRHAEHVAQFASEADPHLRHGPDQQGWIERVALDYDNVRSAMRFALAEAPALALQIVGSIAFFVWLRGGFAEARLWVDDSLDVGSREPVGLRAKALETGAIVAERLGDIAAEQQYADASLAAYDAAGDTLGRASALRELGKVAIALGETERARATYEELARVAEEVGDPWNGAIALNNLGDLALYDGEWAKVIELCGRSRKLRLGLDDRWGAALTLLNIAEAQLGLGRLGDAGRSVRTALQENVEIGSTMGISGGLDMAAVLAALAKEWTGAAVLLGASTRLGDELGTRRNRYEEDERGRAERETREALGEPAFAAARQRGYDLSREEAIAEAMAVIDALTGNGQSSSE